jgi:hypothetical protein
MAGEERKGDAIDARGIGLAAGDAFEVDRLAVRLDD